MSGGPLQPEDSPGFLLWRASNRWQRAMVAALRPLGLTHVQFVLLASAWWLGRARGAAPSQRELAAHAGTDPMMTSQVVRALEARGLVAREPDPRDARARRVTTTAAGARLAERSIAVVEAADREFFAGADAAELLRTLRSLAGTDQPGSDPPP